MDIDVNDKTRNNFLALYDAVKANNLFGRSFVEAVLGIKAARASAIIKILLERKLQKSVSALMQ